MSSNMKVFQPPYIKMIGTLDAKKIDRATGKVIVDYGTVSWKVVTNAFINYFVDALQADTPSMVGLTAFKWHGSGTDSTGDSASDTGLVAAVGGRIAGTQEEGGAANIYQSVATITYADSFLIKEHGLFNDSAAGILMDRSSFAAIGGDSTESIAFTYKLTVTGS